MASTSPACCCCCCCSLQLHLLRRPAPVAVLLSPTTRPLRLLLRIPPLRLRAQAQASPSPEPSPESSFAGWSDEDQDKDAAAAGPFGGLLGPGLAGLFFLAGITYAAISIRTPTGSIPQIETHGETASYSTDISNTTDKDDAAQEDPTTDEAAATLESSDLVPTDGKHAASNEAAQPHNLITSEDGTEITGPDPTLSNSAESGIAAAYDDKPSEAAGPSEGSPDAQDTSLQSELPSPENRRMDDDYDDDALTSDIMVLDSGDVVPIQASHQHEIDTEQQNHQLSDNDEASRFPDYVENVSAGQTLRETLASDHGEGQNESDDQNDELFKSAAPGKSFSFAGIPAPSLLSAAALQVPAGQIVVPAAVDPTQGSALAALANQQSTVPNPQMLQNWSQTNHHEVRTIISSMPTS